MEKLSDQRNEHVYHDMRFCLVCFLRTQSFLCNSLDPSLVQASSRVKILSHFLSFNGQLSHAIHLTCMSTTGPPSVLSLELPFPTSHLSGILISRPLNNHPAPPAPPLPVTYLHLWNTRPRSPREFAGLLPVLPEVLSELITHPHVHTNTFTAQKKTRIMF